MTPEERKIYNKNYQDERKKERLKQSEERAAAVAEINSYVDMDLAGKHFPGEVLPCADLWKIYMGVDREEDPNETRYKKDKKKLIKVAGSKIFEKLYTFQEWLDERKRHRSDLWLLMQTVGRGAWNEQAHKPLADFFVKKDNTKLKPKYTQDQMNKCLLDQDWQHDRLLLYPRGFRKSTVNIIDAVQWIINFADIVILIVSSTKPLGKKLIAEELRGYFSVKDYDNPTNFQLLFPEYCIAIGSGDKREYRCPVAHLGLKDPTVSFSSMESPTAGVRADVIKFDDAVDELNYKMVEQRQSVNAKYDAACELLIRPFAFCDAVGTRYTDGKLGDAVVEGKAVAVPDMYKLIIDRNKASDDKSLKVLRRSAWTVKPEAADKRIKELTEEDVQLLCPEGPGLFKVLRKKLLANESWFRCQQLNEPAAEVAESTYINTFTEENLRTCTYQYSMAPKEGDLLIAWDTAMTDKKTSDYSCGAAVRVYKDDIGRFGLSVLEITFERWSQLETAQRIVAFGKKWNPKNTRIERLPGAELFVREVNRQMLLQDYRFDVFWAPPDPKPNAKRNRIMGLQTLHAKGLFQIVSGPWIDETYKQLTQYTGEKSNKGRKDEIPDVLGHLTLMLPPDEGSPEALLYQAAQEAQIERGRKSAEYNQIFSSPSINPSVQPVLDLMTDNGRGEMNIPCAPKYGIPGLRR